MSMSSLSPPVVVYPNTATPQPTSHSKGSFGPVFIVLAIIIVFSAFACCLGQICARRCSRKTKKDRQNVHPKDGSHHDIEFGFKKKAPSSKHVGHGEIRPGRPFPNGEIKGARKFDENFGGKGGPRFDEDFGKKGGPRFDEDFGRKGGPRFEEHENFSRKGGAGFDENEEFSRKGGPRFEENEEFSSKGGPRFDGRWEAKSSASSQKHFQH